MFDVSLLVILAIAAVLAVLLFRKPVTHITESQECAVSKSRLRTVEEKLVVVETKVGDIKESTIRQGERMQTLETHYKEIKDDLSKISKEVHESSLTIAKNQVRTAWMSSLGTAIIGGALLGVFNFILKGV